LLDCFPVAPRVAVTSHKEMNMNAKMIVAVVFAFPFGAVGVPTGVCAGVQPGEVCPYRGRCAEMTNLGKCVDSGSVWTREVCGPGYKIKAKLDGLFCTSSTASAATCMACCEKDATKCGGQDSIACGAGKYLDPSKAGTAIGSDKVAACCKARAASYNFTCASRTEGNSSLCRGGTANVDQFGNWRVYDDPLKADNFCCNYKGEFVSTGKCCTEVATTSLLQGGGGQGGGGMLKRAANIPCPGGYKRNATVWKTLHAALGGVKCSGGPSTCFSGPMYSRDGALHWACEKDATTCGGQASAITCDAGTYLEVHEVATKYEPSKTRNVKYWVNKVGKDKATCCLPMATCAATTTTSAAQKLQMSAIIVISAMVGVVALWK